MPAEEDRSAGASSLGKPHPEHYTLDALAKGLATESLSRGQALRMIGSALAGGALAVFIPGVAWGQQDGPVDFGPNGPVNHGPNGPVNHGPNGPVNHGPNGPVNSGSTSTCGGVCSEDSQCGAGCVCACPHAGAAYYTCC
jgi:hypothetical protein